MKKTFLFFGLLFSISFSFAQQESSFSHYMFNQQIINPAYAGARGLNSFTSIVRSQWSGIEGAPLTQTLSFNAPISSKNLGFGLSVLNDKIGPISTTSGDIDFSYHLRLNQKGHRLSIGLKAGVVSYLLDSDKINTSISNDPSFVMDFDRKLIPNIGFGLYYYTQNFYLGFATPRLVENKDFGIERHAYFLAGGLFNLNTSLMLKPSLMYKQTKSIAAFDASLLGIVNELFWAGVQVRNVVNSDNFQPTNNLGTSVLLGLSLGERFSLGYSYGIPSSMTNKGFNTSTHELMLRYDLIARVKGYLRSPRFF
jgi:type IX secretion system PorP/SprF family membrane protein